ncbi:hypothetical protein C7H19_10385 [Aphanothece hegewaldii CCALA 016]|uniref:Carrier domain-containing protein n=1 Tax=Aphanothece hegewaldii CCALA 016 TaxID=2107694 RepID=A0A2T1LYT5_9CHRO|nr:HAD-IIIC family phosphatase [Aphanothece hegewaldii]PSF37563.1 hypothetical protein C7H19_10385 [Aphanothece hegewaldii CCALA 016]
MSLQELLNELAEKGVQLKVEENNLRIRAPKNSLSEHHRNQLSEYKEEIILLLQLQSFKEEPIKPISRNLPLYLSVEQERLWLANQISSNNAVYNLVQAIQIKGKLKISLLEKSLNRILERHEALRTTFAIQDSNLIQVINDFTCSLNIENCQSSEINIIADEEAQKPFDLEDLDLPLWRFRLLKTAESEYILIFTFHHLIGDILSTSILIKELAEIYQSFVEQKKLSLPNLTIQYADFASWQRQKIATEEIQQKLNYWQNEFKEIPQQLKLPYDFPKSNLQGKHQTFKLSKEDWLALKQFSQQQNVTPAIILLTVFETLLYKITQQKEIIIGFPTSGRFHSQLDSLIGFFAYPLPFKINLSDSLTFQDLLKQVRDKNIEIAQNQNVPFSQIVEKIKPQSGLFQVLFSTFLGNQLNTIRLPAITFTLLPEASRTPSDLDLLWSLYEVEEELHGVIGYNKSLFELATIQEVIQSYCNLIKQCIEFPERSLNKFQLSEKLEAKTQKNNLVISATFTAEPIINTLEFWLEELKLSYQIEFAPYNQVFQQLLNTESLLRKNQNGINCILFRFEDWLRFDINQDNEQDKLERNLQDFILGLQEISQHNINPLIVCICPSSSIESKILEEKFIIESETLQGINFITSSEINQFYPVKDYENLQGNELGHIPYTTNFFIALGTTIIRRIHSLKQTPYKVIALDCDNTLWHGVCGEDGVEKIIIDESCRQLQHFIIEQKNKGMLLCLCSKNNEEDVREVFEKRLDMILKWTDFVDVQINWQDKSRNLKLLSEKLNLGIDSFIFIDDNPVQCAEIKANYPEILTIELPENRANISQFLNHIWAFDKHQTTVEDAKRTNFYQKNIKRQEVLQKSLTLGNFINSLNIQVKISYLEDEQFSRIYQLIQRTNQFKTTTIRRTENEIQNLLNLGYTCLTVDVKDRFGDYGLVGAIIYQDLENLLKIDTFLLSCRTLGRGVEYQMMVELGKIALAKNIEWIEINYQQTDKNQPILDFLQRIAQNYRDGYCFRFPAIYASQIIYNPNAEVAKVLTSEKPKSYQKIIANSDLYSRIATQLASPKQINQKMLSLFKKTYTKQNYVPPRNKIETCLAKIWSELLKVAPVGIYDNFFELGGDSILMIQVVVQMKKAGLDITPMQLLENQTIAELATIIQIPELAVVEQTQNTKIDDNQDLDTESYTPSDFPDVDLTQEELDNLLSSLE